MSPKCTACGRPTVYSYNCMAYRCANVRCPLCDEETRREVKRLLESSETFRATKGAMPEKDSTQQVLEKIVADCQAMRHRLEIVEQELRLLRAR